MKGAWIEGKGGRCRVSYEVMVYEIHEFGRLTEKLARRRRNNEKFW